MVTVLATSSPATLLFLLVMVGVSTARPGAPPSHVEDIRLIVVRLSQQARSLLLPADLLSGTTFWGDLLKLLHLFGITNEDIFQWLETVETEVVEILSQLPPHDITKVEIAAGDILGMIQAGDVDLERLKTDVDVIYMIIWPYVDDSLKPRIKYTVGILIFLWILWSQLSMSLSAGDLIRPLLAVAL